MNTMVEIAENVAQLLWEDADELGQRIYLPLLRQECVL